MSSPAPTMASTPPKPTGSAGSAGTARARLPHLAHGAVDRARLRVVPRRRVDAARVPFLGLVSLILLTGVVGLLLFNTSLQQASFASTALESQAATMTAREEALRMDLATQRDPQRVARRAQQMGMVIPAVPTFVTLDGQVLGEGTPAAESDRFPIEPAPVANPFAAPGAGGADRATGGATGGATDGTGASAPQQSEVRDRKNAEPLDQQGSQQSQQRGSADSRSTRR